MNQNFYYETGHQGLVSDDHGKIKMVSVDSNCGSDSIKKVLEYENQIEKIDHLIQSDTVLLKKEIYSLSYTRPILILSEIAVGLDIVAVGLFLGTIIIPLLYLPCAFILYQKYNHFKNKTIHTIEDRIKNNKGMLSSLKDECDTFKIKSNYKVIEPSKSLEKGDYSLYEFDVSFHNSQSFDKPMGKVFTLTKEFNRK